MGLLRLLYWNILFRIRLYGNFLNFGSILSAMFETVLDGWGITIVTMNNCRMRLRTIFLPTRPYCGGRGGTIYSNGFFCLDNFGRWIYSS